MSEDGSEEAGFMSTKAFDEACQALARRSGSTSCDMSLDTRKDGEHQYLKIVRFLSTDPYSPARSHSNELLSAGQDSQCIHESGEIEEEVEDVVIYHAPLFHTVSSVEYHILRSTSYRVPVLYFFVHNLPPSMSQSIDTIYENLVPNHRRPGLRDVSVLGGIGITVHPCNSAEAMCDILGGIEGEVSPVEYLMLWIGLVGSAVGLSLPKEIALEREKPS